MAKVENFEITYDGAGPTVEAVVKINGKYVATVFAASYRMNKQAKELIEVLRDHLTKEQVQGARDESRKSEVHRTANA